MIYSRSGNTSTWESVGFSDGRIQKTTSGIDVNYHLTDHLGSVRVVFNQDGTLIAQNSYYPFGGRHDDATSLQSASNRFLYNGKEEQTTGELGYLDYGARMCDAELGRWFGTDPAEQYVSPYVYCGNNPMLFIDPNGMLATIYEDAWGNELLNTNDGSDAVVTVPNSELEWFKDYINKARGLPTLDSKGWNYYMKGRFTGVDWNDNIELNYSFLSANVAKLEKLMSNFSMDELLEMNSFVSVITDMSIVYDRFVNSLSSTTITSFTRLGNLTSAISYIDAVSVIGDKEAIAAHKIDAIFDLSSLAASIRIGAKYGKGYGAITALACHTLKYISVQTHYNVIMPTIKDSRLNYSLSLTLFK